jgi:hypothetical protein
MQSTVMYVIRTVIYVPTLATIQGGGYLLEAPVYTYPYTRTGVQAIVDHGGFAIEKGVVLTAAMWKTRTDPLLSAVKVRSWKALAQQTRSYSLDYSTDTITLYVSKRDPQGRYMTDDAKTRIFPIHTRDALIDAIYDAMTQPLTEE